MAVRIYNMRWHLPPATSHWKSDMLKKWDISGLTAVTKARKKHCDP